MKKLTLLAASALAPVALMAALSAPSLAFAQSSNDGVTRAQVRSELARLEAAGYNPSANSINYPQNIQAAEARANGASPGTVQGLLAGSRGQ